MKIVNKNDFDYAKRKILNDLNEQVVYKGNDWLFEAFWKYMREKEENEENSTKEVRNSEKDPI